MLNYSVCFRTHMRGAVKLTVFIVDFGAEELTPAADRTVDVSQWFYIILRLHSDDPSRDPDIIMI